MSEYKGYSNDKKNQHNSYHKINVGDKGKEVLQGINENSHIIKQFKKYAIELDTKHDRYERIVKINRDITIESKRIIFLLHTLDKESKRNTILEEAETRINNLIKILFKNIALELYGHDPYLYLKAYRTGFQEFIEAISFYWYLQNNTLFNWTKLAESMRYRIKDLNENEQYSVEEKTIQTLIAPVEYILGIADLTGELMRKCINNLSNGDISSCYQICNFVRNMYKGFLSCAGITTAEVNKKMYVLKQNLLKMENVCYTIKVRGSEIPKHMLADVAIVATEDMTLDIDEGYRVY
ncbi:PREDICTED: translin-associated protein X [Ceratosolen solmsi marchali]|uniref:Translin-associated protein X n=1 Tax=Ceratosolen solmsi marchali TaxID=326594 RepID=A0AAJ6YEF1_9HYME|nr:PREDICTED: translin-associated protein X [Ceratosolen solmsi marchali]